MPSSTRSASSMKGYIQTMISKLFLPTKDVVEFDDLLEQLKKVSKDTVRTVKANGVALEPIKAKLPDKALPQRH